MLLSLKLFAKNIKNFLLENSVAILVILFFICIFQSCFTASILALVSAFFINKNQK